MAGRDITLARLAYVLEAETKGLKADLDAAEGSLGKFSKFVAANPVAAMGAFTAAVLGVGLKATQMAAEVDTAMQRVANAVPGASGKLEELKDVARELSDEFGLAQTEISGEMEALAKTGIESADELIAATRAAVLAQKASGESFETINQSLDASLDAFKLSGEDANTVLATLIETAKGKTNLQDLGDLINKIGPDFAAAGLDFGTTATAIAKVQAEGGTAKQQLSALTGLLKTEGVAGVRAFAGEVVPAAVALEAMQAAADRNLGTVAGLSDVLRTRLNNAMIEFGEKALPLAIKGLELLNEVIGHFTGSTKATAAADTIDSIVKSIDAMKPEQVAARKQALDDLGAAMRDLADGPGGALRNQFDSIGHGIKNNIDNLGTPALERLRDGLAKTVEAGDLTQFELKRVRDGLVLINTELLKRGDKPIVEAPPPEVPARIKNLITTVKELTERQRDGAKASKDLAGDEKVLTDRRKALNDISVILRTEEGALLTDARKGLEKLREEMILAGGDVQAVDKLLKPLNDKLSAIEQKNLKKPAAELKVEVGNIDAALKAVDTTLGDITTGFDPVELRAGDVALAVADITLEALAAAEQFGVISGEAYTALGHVIDIGLKIDALKNASFTQILAGLPGIIGSLTGLLGTVFGESPADQERKRILKENTERLEELTEVTGDLVGAQSSGQNFAGVAAAIGARGGPAQTGNGPVGEVGIDILRNELLSRGLTFSDLDQVAADLGITIRDKDGRLLSGGLRQLLAAITSADTGLPGDFRSRKRNVDDEIATGIRSTDSRFQGLLGAGGTDNAISRAISGIDVSTDAGREQATGVLQQLFQDLNAGKLKLSDFGNLSRDDFSELLTDLIGILRSEDAIAGPGNQGSTDPVDIGDDIATSLSTALDETLGEGSPAVDYLAEIARNTAAFSPVGPPSLPAGLRGGVTGSPNITITFGPTSVSVGAGAVADPGAIAAAVDSAISDRAQQLVDELLGQAILDAERPSARRRVN